MRRHRLSLFTALLALASMHVGGCNFGGCIVSEATTPVTSRGAECVVAASPDTCLGAMISVTNRCAEPITLGAGPSPDDAVTLAPGATGGVLATSLPDDSSEDDWQAMVILGRRGAVDFAIYYRVR